MESLSSPFIFSWAGRDSNPRSLQALDLQSSRFDRLPTYPKDEFHPARCPAGSSHPFHFLCSRYEKCQRIKTYLLKMSVSYSWQRSSTEMPLRGIGTPRCGFPDPLKGFEPLPPPIGCASIYTTKIFRTTWMHNRRQTEIHTILNAKLLMGLPSRFHYDSPLLYKLPCYL